MQGLQEVYLAELARAFADRLKEHTSNSRTAIKTSAVAEHRALTGHKTKFDNITILDKGVKNTLCRRIKEFIFNHKELQPKLNKDD